MKQGITMISLVIYVILFFGFTVLAISISSNLNYRILNEKGMTVANENYLKLYTNLLDSAKKSTTMYTIGTDTIYFSNGDVYKLFKTENLVNKNGGVLVKNVEDLLFKSIDDITIDSSIKGYVNKDKCFVFNVQFKKYNYVLTKNIVITLGDDISE